jgi:hypothetical protein
LHTAFHQVRDEVLVWIAGCYIPFGVVRLIVQRHVVRIRVEDHDHLSLGVPIGDVVRDELKVEDRSLQIPSNAKAGTLKSLLAESVLVIIFHKLYHK